MQERRVSIEEWVKLNQQGVLFPVQTVLYGNSMRPLIRYNRDLVRIEPVARNLLRGDIVLFCREDGKYVVHRIVRIKEDNIQTLGDACRSCDKWMERGQILGLITNVYRDGGHRIHVDSAPGRSIGRLWSRMLPLRNILRRVWHFAKYCHNILPCKNIKEQNSKC